MHLVCGVPHLEEHLVCKGSSKLGSLCIRCHLMLSRNFTKGNVPSTYIRKILVVLYNCNKGHKMGTLLNPMHRILHVHALGSKVFNYWRFFIDLKASSPTPPIGLGL